MKKTISTFLAATLLATASQAAEPATQANAVNADPALWVVKDDDTTIYLFGTIHAMKPEVQWFDGGVKSAYNASSEVVIEMIQPEPAAIQAAVRKYAIDPKGVPLTTKLPTKTLAAYKTAMESLNQPVAAYEPFEPWFIVSALGVLPLGKYGFSVDAGIEQVLTKATKADGKKLSQLETMDEQLGFFDTLPEATQVKLLDNTLKELPNYGTLMNTMLGHWSDGRPDRLGVQMNKALKSTPEVSKVLLSNRNANWANWIENRLKTPGTTFVAVGAGHLAGKESVQSYLKRKKIKAVRIPS
jgi:uncharacterized protein